MTGVQTCALPIYGMHLVRDYGKRDVADASFGARHVLPGQVRVLAVHRYAEHDRVSLSERFDGIAEGHDFGRADGGGIRRLEEQHDIPAPVLTKPNRLEALGDDRGRLEIRRRSTDGGPGRVHWLTSHGSYLQGRPRVMICDLSAPIETVVAVIGGLVSTAARVTLGGA